MHGLVTQAGCILILGRLQRSLFALGHSWRAFVDLKRLEANRIERPSRASAPLSGISLIN